jgi:hypothetical protein
MKRGARLVGVVAITAACSGVAFVAGRQLKSPADAAADRTAPEASKITVAVEKRALSADVILRGDIAYAEPSPVALGGSVGGGTGGAASSSVATRVPELGSEITEGIAALEVTGRPVFAFVGAAPMYRALTPGITGPDVRQLEEALARAGVDPGVVDDVYDNNTERAIDQFYERSGYASQGPTKEQRDQLTTLRQSVTAAQTGLRAAQRSLADGGKPASAGELLELQIAVDEAQRTLDDARLPISAVKLAELTDAVAAAELAVVQAKATAERDALSEASEQQTRAVALSQAQSDWLAALKKLGEVTVRGAINPTTGEPYTPAEVAEVQKDVNTKQEAVRLAGDALVIAQASLEPNRLAREQSIRVAEKAVVDAQAKVAEAQLPKSALELRKLENAVTLSRQRLVDARTPKDVSTLRQAVDDAQAQVQRADKELGDVEALVGTTVPAGEVLFFKALPVQVNELKVTTGDSISGQFMTVSGSAVAVNASVSSRDVDLISKGQAATIDLRDSGVKLPGTIASVAKKAGTDGAGEGRYAVKITPDDPVQAQQFAGASAVVVVAVESTAGAEVLAVPLAALSSSADGTTRVEVLEADDTTREVKVTVGLSAEGYAQITPIDGALAAGDRVVVGIAPSGPLSTAAPSGDGSPSSGPPASGGEPVDGGDTGVPGVPVEGGPVEGEPVPAEEAPQPVDVAPPASAVAVAASNG